MVPEHLQLQVEEGSTQLLTNHKGRSAGQLIFWVLHYDFQFNKSVYSGKGGGTWCPERCRKQKCALSGAGVVFDHTAWHTYYILSVALLSSAKCLLEARV